MNLWNICEGKNNIQKISVIAWRVTEDQKKSYTRKLVDTHEEHDILEDLLESSKPNVNAEIYRNYHYLLFTPFRYPPLKHGSRFGREFEPSLWYGSLKVETALYEFAYYKLLFLQHTTAQLKLELILSAFSVKASSDKSIDLTKKPFDQYRNEISSPNNYEVSHQLGTAMRENEIELFLFYSARTVDLEKNIGIFYPTVFKTKKLNTEPSLWNCYADNNVIEFWHFDKTGKKQKLICHSKMFSSVTQPFL